MLFIFLLRSQNFKKNSPCRDRPFWLTGPTHFWGHLVVGSMMPTFSSISFRCSRIASRYLFFERPRLVCRSCWCLKCVVLKKVCFIKIGRNGFICQSWDDAALMFTVANVMYKTTAAAALSILYPSYALRSSWCFSSCFMSLLDWNVWIGEGETGLDFLRTKQFKV